MMKMRRKEREVTDAAKINAVIDSCDCCRLGFVDGDEAYIVPVNFAMTEEEGKRVFYIHGAKEGRKAGLIRERGRCSFEMDTTHKVMTADTACDYSFLYQSVMGKGSIAFVEDVEKKAAALNLIMGHYSGKADWSFPEEMLKRTGLMRLEVDEISCKEHL